jgi:hypothetical protein
MSEVEETAVSLGQREKRFMIVPCSSPQRRKTSRTPFGPKERCAGEKEK